MSESSSKSVWFITGASSGFGRAVTELVLQEGHRVIATLRTPLMLDDLVAQYSSAQLVILQLDVTNKADVAAAFARGRIAFGKIDVVYSNAGYTFIGEVEDSPDKTARSLFDTNFWGAAYVAQEALRFFRDANPTPGGRLLQVSSFLSHACIPTAGFYCASKAALEALTESMSQELSEKWNIKVTLIQPGLYPTQVISGKTAVIPLSTRYDAADNPSRAMRGHITAVTATRKSVSKYATRVYRLAQVPSPPLHLALGDDALEAMRVKIELLLKEMDEYAAWSTDLDA